MRARPVSKFVAYVGPQVRGVGVDLDYGQTGVAWKAPGSPKDHMFFKPDGDAMTSVKVDHVREQGTMVHVRS